jgi:hypothetical protein
MTLLICHAVSGVTLLAGFSSGGACSVISVVLCRVTQSRGWFPGFLFLYAVRTEYKCF